MTDEYSPQASAPTAGKPSSPPSDAHESESAGNHQNGSHQAQEAVVVVRGEAVQTPGNAPSKSAQSSDAEPKKDKPSESKPVSATKVGMQRRLPALEDDADVGVQRDQVVTRDGKADLAFPGTLLASVAPLSAPKGSWQEYRVYATTGGKHVFSKISRSVYVEESDKHEAEVFDPSPASMPSALLRSARDLTRSRPMTWEDAAASFFGYDPLAKALYRKLGGQFEEHIS